MIALLKYGSGVLFNHGLKESLGTPLPASTLREIAEKTAVVVKPAFEDLVRQAAQGELVYNADTAMKILAHMAEASSSEAAELLDAQRSARSGGVTSGIVSTREARP
jgi:transposase